ncbi:MAG: SRPBCC domain-containing protein [Actinomycetota bacterium]
MTVIDVRKDPEHLAMTITADFDAPVERVWQVWADPRRLERWWGPPMYPATFVDHDLTPGGRMSYFMTGPEGEKYHGWWVVRTVEAPNGFEFEDGFADDSGVPNSAMPITVTRVRLQARTDGGTTMTMLSTFDSLSGMEQLVQMGMEEGIKLAIGQIDGVLAV